MISSETKCVGCGHVASNHVPSGGTLRQHGVRCWRAGCKCRAFVLPPGMKQILMTPGGRFAVPDDDFFAVVRSK